MTYKTSNILYIQFLLVVQEVLDLQAAAEAIKIVAMTHKMNHREKKKKQNEEMEREVGEREMEREVGERSEKQ